MNRLQISGLVAIALFVCGNLGQSPTVAQPSAVDEVPGNQLFYGEWFRGRAYKERAGGKTWVDMVTVRMAPGKAITRRGARVTLRREFELIKDFGDRMIVAMTTSQPGSEIRTTMVGVLNLKRNMTWDGKPETIEGRAVLQLYFRQCYGKKSREFHRYMLDSPDPSERWRRIQARSNKEIRGERFVLPGSCAIDAHGKPRGFYTAIDYYRVLNADEQVRVDAGELGLEADIGQRRVGE